MLIQLYIDSRVRPAEPGTSRPASVEYRTGGSKFDETCQPRTSLFRAKLLREEPFISVIGNSARAIIVAILPLALLHAALLANGVAVGEDHPSRRTHSVILNG